MPAAWASGISAVAGLAGSAISASGQASAAQTAAQEQQQAAQLASQTQLQMYNQTRSDLAPYLQTGTGALSQLASMFGIGGAGGAGGTGPTAGTAQNTLNALQNYPGYQFQLNQGTQALDRSAASRGLLLSGAQLKDTQAFGQGLAQSSALQPYLSQLDTLSGLGENAGAMTGNAATAAGQGIASSQLAGGQAAASGAIGGANALTSGIQGGLNSALLGYGMYQGNNGPEATDFSSPDINPLSVQSTNTLDPSLLQNYAYSDQTLSDRRTKKDIKRIGKTDDGLPIYTFRYKAGGPIQMGVMAQDVEKVKPSAVKTVGGLKTVNYGKISPVKSPLEAIRKAA